MFGEAEMKQYDEAKEKEDLRKEKERIAKANERLLAKMMKKHTPEMRLAPLRAAYGRLNNERTNKD